MKNSGHRFFHINRLLRYAPELMLSTVSLYWFIDNLIGAGSVNYLMLAVIAAVVTLIVWRSMALALVVSSILGLGSLYMLLAVFSEAHEFRSGDPDGTRLLLTGSLVFITTLAMAILLPQKYLSKPKNEKLEQPLAQSYS